MDFAEHVSAGVYLVGRVRLQLENRDIPIGSQKARSIVALVSLSDSHEIPRGALCSMLWPDSDASHARASLRQTLRRLKSDMDGNGSTIFQSQRDVVRADFGKFEFEHKLIISAVESGSIPETLLQDHNIVEHFLSDIDGLTAELDSWIAVQRRLYQDNLETALTLLMSSASENASVLKAAKALVVLEPTNELACRTLMRNLAETGQSAAALRVYNTLYGLLDREFDIEPTQETIDLVADIKLDNVPGSIALPTPNSDPAIVRPIIVVSPFLTSDGKTPSSIVRAFAQDLLTVLIRFREWNVVSGIPNDTSNNHYVLQGAEITDGAVTPTLSVVLQKSSTGQYLWSERLELSHNTWAANQSMIARRFATAIDNNISTERLYRMKNLVPENSGVFDRWLYCQHLNAMWKPEAGERIPDILKGIIEEEPLFAPAHAELAANYNSRHIFFPGMRRSSKFRERALYHSRMALKVDPLETRSQRVMAWTNLMRGEHDLAEIHFHHALELNASNPFTMMSSAQGLAFCGKTEQAVSLAHSAIELQPALPGFLQGYLVGVNFLDGRYEEAINASKSAGDSISNLLGWEASAQWHLGRKDEAKDTARSMLQNLAPNWHGEEPFSKSSVCDWFINSFPIRDKQKRSHLENGLRSALERA